ncbi:hypothetical protein SAMN05216388_102938 [Halorientalis persicus]|uniref:Uncharacterized protein n=1 Tax=Halorientalis persicus TaxID=1367881 RepID=A0A1H8URB8_9EURY|nr:hypothetical protein [Halorientalis persicus]SEP05464.1 hypothetical protein SAMN05216388_102938 [Halorientalis persicus]
MSRRREVLATLASGAGLLAGCSESTQEETPTDEPTPDGSSTDVSSETETRTVRPWEGLDRLVEVTERTEKDDDRIPIHGVTNELGLGACLQRYTYETYSSFHGGDVWRTHRRLHVGVGPDATIEDVRAAYESDYYPPSKPFDPVYGREIIEGTETDEGIEFDAGLDGDIKDVRLPFDLVDSADGYRVDGDNNVVVPYDNLLPHYLSRPLYQVDVTTTRADESYLLKVPHPDVSMSVQAVSTNETDDGLMLQTIATEVTMDSKKPTQYVNLHTNYGSSASYDYGREIEADDFTAIDGQGTVRIERDFSQSVGSVDQYCFREFYPIDRLNFDVVLGQVAPLASEAVSADRFIP